MSKPMLMKTTKYEIFDVHENNRPQHRDPVLFNSMKKHGFMPSSPIHVVRNGEGKFKVKRGHHRLQYATELGLPVYFIVDDTDIDIFDLEGGRQLWNVSDYAAARAKAGSEDCRELLEFMQEHHLTIGSAASLVGGESAGSHNKMRAVKTGLFKQGDMRHANDVVAVTDRCRKDGIAFATSTAFVAAISMCIRVPEFKTAIFIHKIETMPASLRKRSTRMDYLEEIEAFYNYASKNPIPLALLAKEASKNRQVTFGGPNVNRNRKGK